MSGIVFARKQICRKLLIPSIISIKDIREYAPVHFLYLFVRMFFEVSFGYLDRGMSHGITNEFLLIIPIIGNGSPTVAGTVAAQPFHPTHIPCQPAKAIIEVAQRILVLAVFVIARTADKREKVG